MSLQEYQCDTLIVGGGIAGIVTALELLQKGQQVIVVDRDSKERFGGLARWAFGGMCLVGTPEQKRMGIRDTPEQALQDWHSFAEFSEADHWPKRWAEYYVNESYPRVYRWLRDQGLSFFPAVNWVERGLYTSGNSLPRYHILWGCSLAMTETLIGKLLNSPRANNLTVLHHHRVDELLTGGGHLAGAIGKNELNGSDFTVSADNVVVATGGINGTLERVRENWYKPWGEPPSGMLNGAHPYADGKIHDQVNAIGGQVTHADKMWNYAAGIPHPQPHFPDHGLSLIPCKSALWLNHRGERIGPDPLVTGFDTNYLCQRVAEQDKPYTWQLLNWRIAAKEFAISGAEHNQPIRDKKLLQFLKESLLGNHRLIRQMQTESDSFLVADNLSELVEKMNALTGTQDIELPRLQTLLDQYDSNFSKGSSFFNDDQIRRIEHARHWRSDKIRTCKPAPIQDPKAGPLIAIRLQLISRKSLGGIQTDLKSRVLDDSGSSIPGLYAVGEAAGFGGGGASGKRSLEGTFLPGCILTARAAAAAITEP